MLTDKKIYIAATGAGAGAQRFFWQTPGCSAYFAGACFPYRQDLLEEFIGYCPEKFVSEDVAIAMAMRAYQCAWSEENDNAVGIGCSAAVSTNRWRKGKYVAYISECSIEGVYLWELNLEKGIGTYSRMCDDDQINRLIFDIADDKAIDDPVDVTGYARKLLMARPYWRHDNTRLSDYAFEREVVSHATDTTETVKRTIFPGAFNPPHVGHLEIAKKTNAVFNIELSPPHKSPLSVVEVLQRLKMLKHHDVLLTEGLPLYLDKSNSMPNHPIVMGADAFLRMLDPKWGPTPKEILTQFSQNMSRIYVFGREIDGKYVSADEAIAVTEEIGIVFDVQPVTGRWDISSSQIRKGAKK